MKIVWTEPAVGDLDNIQFGICVCDLEFSMQHLPASVLLVFRRRHPFGFPW